MPSRLLRRYWTNFVLVSAVYVALSFRVFHITAALRDTVIPKEGGQALAYRAVTITLGVAAFYAAGCVFQSQHAGGV